MPLPLRSNLVRPVLPHASVVPERQWRCRDRGKQDVCHREGNRRESAGHHTTRIRYTASRRLASGGSENIPQGVGGAMSGVSAGREVAVIGGGIIGTAVTFRLAEAGARVTLLD